MGGHPCVDQANKELFGREAGAHVVPPHLIIWSPKHRQKISMFPRYVVRIWVCAHAFGGVRAHPPHTRVVSRNALF